MENGFIICGKENTAKYRLIALKHALSLETKGIRFSRGKASVSVRNILAENGVQSPWNKAKLLEVYTAWLDEQMEKSPIVVNPL